MYIWWIIIPMVSFFIGSVCGLVIGYLAGLNDNMGSPVISEKPLSYKKEG